jgi:pimeloyl-ACP methyl ester carboxylesterase
MMIDDARRGYPSYRSPSGMQPARTGPRSAVSRGLKISYDDVGEGPTELLVPGFTMSGGDWWELGYVEHLVALGRRILVVDPLGHGQSDRPIDPEAYRWPGPALDIVAVMDQAGVARATFWGYSRGAALVAAAASEAPDRCRGLILGGSGDLTADPPASIDPWIEAMLAGDWAAYWATPVGSTYTPDDRRYCERVNDPRAFAAAIGGRRRFPYELDLGRISAPTLVYCGSEDEPDEADRTAQALGAELRVLPGLDHDSAISVIDQVMAAVVPFLRAANP